MTEVTTAKVDGSGAMFDRIARRYDRLNRVLSVGMDKGWRRHTVRALELQPGHRVLDLATGTADLPLEILRQAPEVTVTGLDPSAGMLEVGREKVAAAGQAARVTLVEGDAQALPFEAASFDRITMAFGIRNVPDRAQALREMVRVLAPGSRAGILELSEPRTGFMAPFARIHIHHVVPLIGAVVSGSKEYRYLQTSIQAFPPPDAFADLMREAGFAKVALTPFAFGACVLYLGEVA
ncbi:MAG: bifunctional demethylmenaquinone methyltransferase/2-methoxy-6-polyprenyl-1,4-benzoquinol methylase UbiE [Deltaproteobacteria bacterium]|nr:bifunctional demethylmenaquinone methyltransferase/2-methoxy-6-polyprenyl-1,4-benzoquinol methylase UbiE [Deltaproteobacteria bacterium]